MSNQQDPKVADYLWEQRERAEQKERFMSQRRDKSHFNSVKEQERRWRITQVNYFFFVTVCVYLNKEK